MLEFPEEGTIVASEKSIKEQLSYCYNEGKKNGAIEELEKLKPEIDKIRDVEVTDGTVYVSSDDVYEILDKRISELKGE